jgi:solute carrier family 10 (sodium/bile acid cotransporter), member 7
VFRRLIPDPFLLLLVGTLLLASFLPARGTFADLVGWLSIATIVLLFFFHGAKLARDQVLAGLSHWRLHLAILACTFILFPLVGVSFRWLAPGLLPPDLWLGILFLCALPSTVQSAIAFVAMAKGNVSAAIASASASQMLGIFITPVLMGLLAGVHGSGGVDLGGAGKIALQILVPFLAGHLLQPVIGGWVQRHRALVGVTDRATILIAVYGAFSAAVIEGLWQRLPLPSLAVLLGVNAVLLAIGLAGSWSIGKALGFNREDRIAILFCGTKKSLVQGVPMAKVLFPGPQGGVILLPIMLFHQMQLMACAFIARAYANRKEAA